MKKILWIIAIAVFPLLMVSCMDFDNPADEFTTTDEELDPEVFHGKADEIDYRKVITEEEFDAAKSALNTYFRQVPTATYYIRGGKNGAMPQEHQYQYVYSLHIDNYSGFFCADQNFGGRLPSTYYYNFDFCDGPYGAFLEVKNNLANMLNHPQIDYMPEIKALGLLLFDVSAQEMVDIYGSIPYVDHKNNKEKNPFIFDKGVDIYATIIDNVDTIVACFDHFKEQPQWYQKKIQSVLNTVDAITMDKSIDSWKRFANSLKLRMAMHCVKAMPEKAKKWAEEAVASGVVESTDQEIALNWMTGCFYHPLVTICNSWNDSRVNASFESLLMSLDHPLTKYFITKNIAAITNTKTNTVTEANTRIIGIRAGLAMLDGQSVDNNPRVGYSSLASDYIQDAPTYYVKSSEVDFLRAEGAVRGWNMGGTAQFFYERGIRNAQPEGRFDGGRQMYSTLVEDYMKLDKAKAYTYVDPMDDANNIESVTTIGVKWNEGDAPEVKLEKIITQKYLALFPYSVEPWTELRRTGYPKLFPVLNVAEYGDGSLKDGDLIRRIKFPGRGTTVGLDDINTTGIDALGGEDLQGTRVWWDVEGMPNF